MSTFFQINELFYLCGDGRAHPACRALRELLIALMPRPTSGTFPLLRDNPHEPTDALSDLYLHPLWDPQSCSIGLYDGTRNDGMRRIYMTECQLQVILDVAHTSSNRASAGTSSPLTAPLPRDPDGICSTLIPAHYAHQVSMMTMHYRPTGAGDTQPDVPTDVRTKPSALTVPGHSAPGSSWKDAVEVDQIRLLSADLHECVVGGSDDRDLAATPGVHHFRTFDELLLVDQINSKRKPNRKQAKKTRSSAIPSAQTSDPQAERLHETSFQHAWRMWRFARQYLLQGKGTWFAVDVEATKANELTEVGIARLRHIPYAGGSKCRLRDYCHIIIDENQHLREPVPIRRKKAGGADATSEIPSQTPSLPPFLRLTEAGLSGPLFIVCHAEYLERLILGDALDLLPGESDWLSSQVVPSTQTNCVYYIDTQVLFFGMRDSNDSKVVERRVHAFAAGVSTYEDADIVGSLIVCVLACLPIDGPLVQKDLAWASNMLSSLREHSDDYSASPDTHSQPAAFYFPSWPHDVFDPTRTAEACATYRRDVLAYEIVLMVERTMKHLLSQLVVDTVVVGLAQRFLRLGLLLLRPGDDTKHTELLFPKFLEQWMSLANVSSNAQGWLIAFERYPRARLFDIRTAVNDVVNVLTQSAWMDGQITAIQVLVEHLLRAEADTDFAAIVEPVAQAFSRLLLHCGGQLSMRLPGTTQPLLASVMMLVRVVLVVSNWSFDNLHIEQLVADVFSQLGPPSTFSTNLCFHAYHELHDPLRLMASALLLTAGPMPDRFRSLAAITILDSLVVRPCSPLFATHDWASNYEGVLTLCHALQADVTPFCPHLAASAMPILQAATRGLQAALAGGMAELPFRGHMGFNYFLAGWDLNLQPVNGRLERPKNLWRADSRSWKAKLHMRFLLFASARLQSLETLLFDEISRAQAVTETSARNLQELGIQLPCVPRPCMRRCAECRS
ncbi:hypothetical protein AURDEDRAFT_176058 [Auricularia subglabra TFB-10046 SS5]|uniref:Uncharacterized protein n=1 Tax=Auricularia subglabra (strain TFB-10046 / SS5) TaxID=717982 RepID=J0WQQ1_AURST|nr:hypothetical protein AURDEDRAFT_176058 [Auricularia subglabra TFB-10046 SS5]